MFRVMFLFIILGAGLFLGTQYAGQQGYVLISIANKTIEMSVTTLIIFIIATLAALFILEFVVRKVLNASSATWNYFGIRKVRRSRRFTNEGIIKLLEGDYQQAEKKVTRCAKHHDMPLLCYLIASEAAQGLGEKQKRDHYLELAAQQEDAQLAVELTRAKQQIREANYPAALSTLSKLKQNYPNNAVILTLLQQVYIELKQWQPLLDLLPKLIKCKIISKEEQDQLIQRAQCGVLHEIASQKSSEGLISHWDTLPRKIKTDCHLIECFAEQLIARQADNEAFTVIKEALKKNPSSSLYSLLPKLKLTDHHPAITFLENALSKDSSNAEANSAIAQFYLREEKWSEAQAHLEKALSIRSSILDYSYLSDALEKQNLTKAAHEVSKKAITLINKPAA